MSEVILIKVGRGVAHGSRSVDGQLVAATFQDFGRNLDEDRATKIVLDRLNDAIRPPDTELDAQRLRADTAEAERDEWKRAAEMHEHDSLQSQQELAAAEQRIAELAALLNEIQPCLDTAASSFKNMKPLRDKVRATRAALNPKPEAGSHDRLCPGCGAKGWTANCDQCIPY